MANHNNKITENDFSKEESDENFVSPSIVPGRRVISEVSEHKKPLPQSVNVSIRDETANCNIFKENVPGSVPQSMPPSIPASVREKFTTPDLETRNIISPKPIDKILGTGNKVAPSPVTG